MTVQFLIYILDYKVMSSSDISQQSKTENNKLDKRLWGPWATTGFGCVIGVVIIAAQILVAIVYTMVKLISDRPSDITEFVIALINDGLLIVVAGILSAIAGIVLITIIVKVRRSYSIGEYLGFRSISIKSIIVLLSVAAGFIALSYLVNYIPGKVENHFMVEAYTTSVWKILFWIEIVILAPVMEEMFFRGFLFVGFRQSRIGVVGTTILTAFIWTLLHFGQYDYYDMAIIFVFGIVLGIVRQKTDSLWGPLVIHSANNLIVMFLIAFSVNNIAS